MRLRPVQGRQQAAGGFEVSRVEALAEASISSGQCVEIFVACAGQFAQRDRCTDFLPQCLGVTRFLQRCLHGSARRIHIVFCDRDAGLQLEPYTKPCFEIAVTWPGLRSLATCCPTTTFSCTVRSS